MSGRSDGIWRFERLGKQGFPMGCERSGHTLARGTRREAESLLSAEGPVIVATVQQVIPYDEVRKDLWRPLAGVSRRFLVALISAFLVGFSGLVAWGYQLRLGLGVTGLQRPVFWGFYIVDF